MFEWLKPVIEWVTAPERDRAALFLERRLGKCQSAIAWALSRNPIPRNILIVAPYSAHDGWLYWLQKPPENRAFVLTGTQDERTATLAANAMQGGFFICNPQGLFHPARAHSRRQARPTDITLFPWDAVIWDETTVGLASPNSQTNYIAQTYLAKCPLRCVLSGLYAPQTIEQIFEPMKWCFGEFMKCRNFYRWRQLNFTLRGFKWFPNDLTLIKQYINRQAYILSKVQAGVKPEAYPEKRYCELPAALRRSYEEITNDYAISLWGLMHCHACNGNGWLRISPTIRRRCIYCEGNGHLSRVETKTAAVVKSWKRQIAGGFPKMFPHLRSEHKLHLLEEVLDEFPEEKAVISFAFNGEIDAAYQRLHHEKKYKCVVFNGLIPTEDRNRMAKAFRESVGPNAPQFILAQCKCICHGLDLSAASTLIEYSLSERHEEVSQPRDRIVNLQNPRPLVYITLLCKDTVDEDVMADRERDFQREAGQMVRLI